MYTCIFCSYLNTKHKHLYTLGLQKSISPDRNLISISSPATLMTASKMKSRIQHLESTLNLNRLLEMKQHCQVRNPTFSHTKKALLKQSIHTNFPEGRKSLRRNDHNYAYPNDVDALRNQCEYLRETVRKQSLCVRNLKLLNKRLEKRISKGSSHSVRSNNYLEAEDSDDDDDDDDE